MNGVTAQLSTPLSPEVESAARRPDRLPDLQYSGGRHAVCVSGSGERDGLACLPASTPGSAGTSHCRFDSGSLLGPLVSASGLHVASGGAIAWFSGSRASGPCAVVLSFFLAGILRRTGRLWHLRHSLFGAFARQQSDVGHIFEQSTAPWTGTTGWINIVVWGLAAIAISRWGGAKDLNG